jgi:hypothetical protein
MRQLFIICLFLLGGIIYLFIILNDTINYGTKYSNSDPIYTFIIVFIGIMLSGYISRQIKELNKKD